MKISSPTFLFSSTGILLSSLLLSGCATTFNGKTGVFRNRELDYLHQPVSQRSALIIPNGVQTPKLEPKNMLPTGPTSYPAETSVDLTPPGFSKVIPIPGEPTKTSGKNAAKTPAPSQSPKSSQEISAEISQIQSQIQQLEAKKQNSKKPTQDVGLSPSTTSTTPASSGQLPSVISSSLTFDHNNVGLLTINAPYAKAWTALETAINQSGYQITKVDKGSHLIYVNISPASVVNDETAQNPSEPAVQTILLLFVTHKNNATQISIFTDKGVLDKSANAYSLLSQLHAVLGTNPSS
jgi:uncharacterized lipoprotein